MAGLDKIVGEQLPLLYFGNTSSSIKQRRIPTMADISKWLLPPPPDGVWSFQGFITLLIFSSIHSPKLPRRHWPWLRGTEIFISLKFCSEEEGRLASVGAEIWMVSLGARHYLLRVTRVPRFFRWFFPHQTLGFEQVFGICIFVIFIWRGWGFGISLAFTKVCNCGCFHEAFHRCCCASDNVWTPRDQLKTGGNGKI